MTEIPEALAAALAALDKNAVTAAYRAQGEFVCLEGLIPASVMSAILDDAERVRPAIHRSYLPGYKKGGSVGYHALRAEAPATVELYSSLAGLVSELCGSPVSLCPEEDPHACALYFYTEPGDHIGFHYDTSHYAGARFTVLVGVVNRSTSTLECHLHTRDHARAKTELAIATGPGTVVIFNGDKVWHRVTALGPGEERVSLSLEYVTSPIMSPARRLLSNVKDAVAYFGFSAVFGGRKG